MTLLVHFDQGYVPWLFTSILAMQGLFLHSCTRVSLGPLRYVIADNRFHRIHHSIQSEHYDRNFGSFTVFWDLIFRTAYMPKPGEWPETGVVGVEEPKRLSEFFLAPFRTSAPESDRSTAQVTRSAA
jgi:sterol desaturase/sphingolipid hydroxylase (fatty acid hydroxylase superfamily)